MTYLIVYWTTRGITTNGLNGHSAEAYETYRIWEDQEFRDLHDNGGGEEVPRSASQAPYPNAEDHLCTS